MSFSEISIRLLVDPDFHSSGDPKSLWCWMRKSYPVYKFPETELSGFWSFTLYEDIRYIYSKPEIFSSAQGVLLRPIRLGEDPGGGLTLALTDPPRHKRLRNLFSQWFTIAYVKSIEDLIKDKIISLIEEASQKKVFNFTHDISARLTLAVTCYILGIPDEDHDRVFKWTYESFKEGKPLAVNSNLMLYLGELIEKRTKEPSNDLASILIHGLVEDAKLTEDELLLNFENLIGATENAGLSMSSGILAFLKNPGSWQQIREDRSKLSIAIEEVLRWASSATHSMRTVTQDTNINETCLKKGDKVVVWIPSANRDESVFKNPNTFDISRLPNPHLALGYGEHFCIGSALGRLQMKNLLITLLDLDKSLRLEEDPKYLRSIYVNGPEDLMVSFTH